MFQLLSSTNDVAGILSKVAKEVLLPLNKEDRKFIDDFTRYFKTFESAAGLAAPQIGKSIRVIAFHIPEAIKERRHDAYDFFPITIFINPKYKPLPLYGTVVDWEGCFSVPDKMGEVRRYAAIEYQAYTPEGKMLQGIARGYFARILQHEIDHLDGKLYTDYITPDLRFGSQEEMMPIRLSELQQRLLVDGQKEVS